MTVWKQGARQSDLDLSLSLRRATVRSSSRGNRLVKHSELGKAGATSSFFAKQFFYRQGEACLQGSHTDRGFAEKCPPLHTMRQRWFPVCPSLPWPSAPWLAATPRSWRTLLLATCINYAVYFVLDALTTLHNSPAIVKFAASAQ